MNEPFIYIHIDNRRKVSKDARRAPNGHIYRRNIDHCGWGAHLINEDGTVPRFPKDIVLVSEQEWFTYPIVTQAFLDKLATLSSE